MFKNALKIFSISALVACGAILAQDAKPEPLPFYPNMEKAIELFLLEWSATGETNLPKPAISVFKEARGGRYQLKLSRKRERSVNFAPPPRFRSHLRFARESENFADVAIVFDPKSGANEAGSAKVTTGRTEFRSGSGFGEEQFYSRSYERSYVRGQAEDGEVRPKRVRPLFETEAGAAVYLFSDENAYMKSRAAAAKNKTLLEAGETEGAGEQGGYFFILVQQKKVQDKIEEKIK